MWNMKCQPHNTRFVHVSTKPYIITCLPSFQTRFTGRTNVVDEDRSESAGRCRADELSYATVGAVCAAGLGGETGQREDQQGHGQGLLVVVVVVVVDEIRILMLT